MKKFTYSDEKEKAKSTRTGFRIVVHESIARFPVINAKISFFPGGRTVTTKGRGMVTLDLEEGTYQYIIKAVGFPQTQGEATVKNGVLQLLYIKLEKDIAKTNGKSSKP